MPSKRDKLKETEGTRRSVTINIDVDGDESRYHGFVVGLSRKLVILHELDEFHLDGYRILRVKDIVSARVGKFEKTFDKIFRGLDVADASGLPEWLRFEDWPDLFRSLQLQDKCVSVESALHKVDIFSLGWIEKVGKRKLTLRSFNASAKWYSKPDRFFYEDITEASFDTEYNRVFGDYMRNQST
jgi:hypothetical protein